MTERVWDKYLTPSDREHLAACPRSPVGVGWPKRRVELVGSGDTGSAEGSTGAACSGTAWGSTAGSTGAAMPLPA